MKNISERIIGFQVKSLILLIEYKNISFYIYWSEQFGYKIFFCPKCWRNSKNLGNLCNNVVVTLKKVLLSFFLQFFTDIVDIEWNYQMKM